MRIQLWHGPDCPLAERLRTSLHQCLRRTETPAEVEESVGDYPSPTLVIDGLDVATGRAPASEACCRLDLPTDTQIQAALHRSRQ